MRAVIVGAGLAGLAAAGELAAHGHEVTVFDKGRSPGGRLATRRIGEARLDHGAQFFTVRGDAFREQVAGWLATGAAREWCRGFGTDDGYPRYAATAGMNSLAKSLAEGLDVRCDHLVFSIRHEPAGPGWTVTIDDGEVHRADAVIVTCPLPQAFTLLIESGIEMPRELMRTDYDRTLAVLTVLDGPSAVPPPGGLNADRLEGTPFSFIGDNQAKGISPHPAVTFHADAAWSDAHWDQDAAAARDELLDAAQPWLGSAEVIEAQLKRWRFATPRRLWPEPCWVAPEGTLVLAGDAFAGPKGGGSNMEGAHGSGRAAAAALALRPG